MALVTETLQPNAGDQAQTTPEPTPPAELTPFLDLAAPEDSTATPDSTATLPPIETSETSAEAT